MNMLKVVGISMFSLLLLFGCSKETNSNNKENSEPKMEISVVDTDLSVKEELHETSEMMKLLYKNYMYAQKKLLKPYLETLYIPEGELEQRESEVQQQFAEYDFEYKFTSAPDVISIYDEAVIRISIERVATRVSPESDFKDHVATFEITFIKVEDEWKIKSMIPDEKTIEYIN